MDNRYERGIQRLKEFDSASGQAVVSSLKDIAPDLGRYMIEFGFGDVYTRPGLDKQQRQIITMSALAATGQTEFLEANVGAALNLGLTPNQIVEIFINLAPFIGFPAVTNAVFAVKKVFDLMGIAPVWENE